MTLSTGRKRLALEVAALLVVVALIVTFAMRRRSDSDRHVDYRFLMGTIVSVTVLTPDAEAGRAAIDAAFDEIARIEAATTRYSEDSEISRLNARVDGFAGERVSREVAEVVARSLAVARTSSGAFDITVAPLVDLWTLNDEDFTVPEESAINAILPSVDWRAVQVATATRNPLASEEERPEEGQNDQSQDNQGDYVKPSVCRSHHTTIVLSIWRSKQGAAPPRNQVFKKKPGFFLTKENAHVS